MVDLGNVTLQASITYLFNKTRALDEMNCVLSVLFVGTYSSVSVSVDLTHVSCVSCISRLTLDH